MSLSSIFIHSVFSVKKRRPVLIKSRRETFFRHIRDHARKNGIELLRINGHDDHVHALLRIYPAQSVAKVMQIIKGESARWANNQHLFQETLIWSKGYYVRSIDPDNLKIVEHYIEGQSKHLPYLSFLREYLHEAKNRE